MLNAACTDSDSPKPLLVEFFAGSAFITRQWRKDGLPGLAVDVAFNKLLDVTDPCILQELVGAAVKGRIAAAWFAPPCASFSRARHGPASSNWPPLRSAEFPNGLPSLRERDQQAVDRGNTTLRATAFLIEVFVKLEIPSACENPSTSFLWSADVMPQLLSLPSCFSSTVDFCAFGARWRKRTRIVAWSCTKMPFSAEHRCKGRQTLCAFSHKPHIILSGVDPVSRVLWTHLAEPYPRRFAFVCARWIAASAEVVKSSRQWSAASASWILDRRLCS